MQRIRLKALSGNVPLHAMLELTDRCNLRCRHCYVRRGNTAAELSSGEWKHVLTELAQAGVLFLTLSGGEPLTRLDFFEIAKEARRLQFAIIVFTNGTLIDLATADGLAALCPQRVEISILGASARSHDAMTGVAGSFRRALRGARLLVERRVPVELKTTWMRTNVGEHHGIFSIAREMGVPLRESFLLLSRRNGEDVAAQLGASEAQLRSMAEARYGKIPRARLPAMPKPITGKQAAEAPPCGAGQVSCRIGATGRVTPCAALEDTLGNVRKRPFPTIWERSARLRRIRSIRVCDLTVCRSCRLFARCRRCAGVAKLETGSILGRSTQACRVANAFEKYFESRRCDLLG
jgi:radical SAM protein with 4Fe4S-binding SPASM domain